MKILPQSRSENIVVQTAGSETLIYDLKINKAYRLNETSAIVFNACNGSTSFDDLKKQFNFTDDLIHFSLQELKANNLLEGELTNYFGNLTRREVIRKVGFASIIALPIISSLVAPTAADAQSTGPICGTTCTCSVQNNGDGQQLCIFLSDDNGNGGIADGCADFQTAGVSCDCRVDVGSTTGTCTQLVPL